MKIASNWFVALLVLLAVPTASARADALDAYRAAVNKFEQVLQQRRAQINSHQALPNLPGQALYLARNDMISTYKDLTDALPSRIGKPNKFEIPPAYFDADNEPLLDQYRSCSTSWMRRPPMRRNRIRRSRMSSIWPWRSRAPKASIAANAEIAGRISLGIFFAETNGIQNAGNARSNKYKGSLQTGPSEDQIGQKKWSAIRKTIASFDPALSFRDDKEEARIGNLDHRLNHWTAVRDGLMSTHADIFPQVAGQSQKYCPIRSIK